MRIFAKVALVIRWFCTLVLIDRSLNLTCLPGVLIKDTIMEEHTCFGASSLGIDSSIKMMAPICLIRRTGQFCWVRSAASRCIFHTSLAHYRLDELIAFDTLLYTVYNSPLAWQLSECNPLALATTPSKWHQLALTDPKARHPGWII